jgi:hypothetical protein
MIPTKDRLEVHLEVYITFIGLAVILTICLVGLLFIACGKKTNEVSHSTTVPRSIQQYKLRLAL